MSCWDNNVTKKLQIKNYIWPESEKISKIKKYKIEKYENDGTQKLVTD